MGDTVDFRRVEALDETRLLRLRAEMKLPGRGWLQFNVEPTDDTGDSTQIIQTAFFEPKGLMGTLYWSRCSPFTASSSPASCGPSQNGSSVAPQIP